MVYSLWLIVYGLTFKVHLSPFIIPQPSTFFANLHGNNNDSLDSMLIFSVL